MTPIARNAGQIFFPHIGAGSSHGIRNANAIAFHVCGKNNLSRRSIDARVGAQLKQLRLTRGITAQQAAEVLGFPESDYIAREEGTTSFQAAELRKLATLFGVELNDVYEGLLLSSPDRKKRLQ